jgi:hypothetical protein
MHPISFLIGFSAVGIFVYMSLLIVGIAFVGIWGCCLIGGSAVGLTWSFCSMIGGCGYALSNGTMCECCVETHRGCVSCKPIRWTTIVGSILFTMISVALIVVGLRLDNPVKWGLVVAGITHFVYTAIATIIFTIRYFFARVD